VIYPTGRAILMAAAGAPLGLAAGLAFEWGWAVAGGWLALVAGLMLFDALVGAGPTDASVTLEGPGQLGLGARGEIRVRITFAAAPPRSVEAAFASNELLEAEPSRVQGAIGGGEALLKAVLRPLRRGLAQVTAADVRWRGPVGLVWKQTRTRGGIEIPITPDIAAVKAQALRFFARDATLGLKAQLDTGEGSEFHALREVAGAVDPRAIDWKQSARHGRLLAKEFRAERNHPVVLAIDAGAGMCAPLAGEPRLDRAINAALLLGFVCLKMGDMAATYGYDARPRTFSGLLSGARSFPRLQRHLAGLDYSWADTNHTLGLSQLGALLKRRSLIVVFTDFADSTSAELMIENLGRLLKRHVVLFVAFRDEELETIAQSEPASPLALSRAVTAHALLKARNVVIARLERLGARIVDAPAGRMGPALVAAYLDLVRAEAV
jgi:uncharacterized protein (DUF58 family)